MWPFKKTKTQAKSDQLSDYGIGQDVGYRLYNVTSSEQILIYANINHVKDLKAFTMGWHNGRKQRKQDDELKAHNKKRDLDIIEEVLGNLKS